ncbi:DUF418 domain-containing protein [Microlunatus soli]|uniref:DUF418 domain-containing protein n=1 Tax=Microlunatus soli TaxID=630515 RepID=A0A1H1YDJ9_9ACTN|nr:DUF418 domain-containing protein [Microlunatus soli]SDT19598.1 uncharacterized protein SAMN04489812_4527 [Microlunatus soli]
MTPPAQRLRSLDVLRGLAILGTLGTNVWLFTNPYGLLGYLAAPIPPGTPAGWAAIGQVLQQLAQGKFLGLLTLMFGIGLEIQRRSAIRRGRPWPGRYPWRAALLLLDGVLHYVLVVEFDVLMGYAVTGAVVSYLVVTSDRAQRTWMIVTGSVHVLVISALTVLLITQPGTAAYPPMRTNVYAEGSWWDLLLLRVQNPGIFRLEPILITGYSIFMFLLGARLLRAGVLEPAGAMLRRRLMIIGGAGFVVDFVIQVVGGSDGVLFGRYTTAALVSLGLLALVTEIVLRTRAGWFSRRLEQIGRMALSSYVAQNLIASILCYGWGFGLATRMSDEWRVPGTMIIFAATAVLIALFAALWQLRFARGPVELAWTWCYDKINSGLDRVLSKPQPEREAVVSGSDRLR